MGDHGQHSGRGGRERGYVWMSVREIVKEATNTVWDNNLKDDRNGKEK
jgi:hypothetical protein